jgi:hypothetical protein
VQGLNSPAVPYRPQKWPSARSHCFADLRLEHRLLQLGFRQKLFEPRVFLLQLSEPIGLFCFHAALELAPAVVRGLGRFQGSTEVGDGLALGDQLLSGLELPNDLLGCVEGSFHAGVPGQVWPDEDSHSPWTDSQGPL